MFRCMVLEFLLCFQGFLQFPGFGHQSTVIPRGANTRATNGLTHIAGADTNISPDVEFKRLESMSLLSKLREFPHLSTTSASGAPLTPPRSRLVGSAI